VPLAHLGRPARSGEAISTVISPTPPRTRAR
jgi:hypothetical protein